MPIIHGVACDKCGEKYTWDWYKENRTKKGDILRKAGWSIGELVVCPSCNNRKKLGIPQVNPDDWYCQKCNKYVFPYGKGICPKCGSGDLVPF